MQHLRTDGYYVCSREDLQRALQDVCTDFFDILGSGGMNESEEKVRDKVVQAALQYWHALAVTLTALQEGA